MPMKTKNLRAIRANNNTTTRLVRDVDEDDDDDTTKRNYFTATISQVKTNENPWQRYATRRPTEIARE